MSVLLSATIVMTLSDGCLSQGRQQLNIYGRPLAICSTDPMTGWYRDGYAKTDQYDHGLHTVCAEMTQQFLDYTKSQGNDLSTPRGSFPGLRPGDNWALCAMRWRQAFVVGKAPKVYLEATNRMALRSNHGGTPSLPTLEELESKDSRIVANP